MLNLSHLKPAFWDYRDAASGPGNRTFSFRRKWLLIVFSTMAVTLTPLFVIIVSDYRFMKDTVEKEIVATIADKMKSIAHALSTTADVPFIEKQLTQFSPKEEGDLFLVNRKGILQSQPKFYGHRFEKSQFAPFETSGPLKIEKTTDDQGRKIYLGVSPLEGSPLLLVAIRLSPHTVTLWAKERKQLIGFLLASMVTILFSVVGVATYLVNRIYTADRRRIQALHQVEYANKMASIGRLASGVAHEVNNPLAIINQKTGLMKDLLVLNEGTAGNEKMMGLVDDVLASVKRCGAITRRMLDFARHMESSSVEEVDIEAVIRQVLAFMEKDAENQDIEISLTAKKNVPLLRCDRGNLQQIFLNLINNAFAAMETGGELNVHIESQNTFNVRVSVSDTGHGIPPEDLNRVFEPFFSTRQGHAGTGLGLSVTYGLVSEMGGSLSVVSKVKKGTTFAIILPIEPNGKNEQ
jgi:signal transduction histidine kinase